MAKEPSPRDCLRWTRVHVEYIANDRREDEPGRLHQSLSQEQLAGIEAVAMDMWDLLLLHYRACSMGWLIVMIATMLQMST